MSDHRAGAMNDLRQARCEKAASGGTHGATPWGTRLGAPRRGTEAGAEVPRVAGEQEAAGQEAPPQLERECMLRAAEHRHLHQRRGCSPDQPGRLAGQAPTPSADQARANYEGAVLAWCAPERREPRVLAVAPLPRP